MTAELVFVQRPCAVQEKIMLQVYQTQRDVLAVCGMAPFVRAREDYSTARYLG